MLIHNESYDDKIMRLRYEMLLMHSKTGQALGLDKTEDFDSALEEAAQAENTTSALEQTPIAETPHITVQSIPLSSGRGTLMADVDSFLSERARRLQENVIVSSAPSNTAESNTVLAGTTQTYWPNDFITGRDTLIAEVAQRYAQAMDISGQHDTVFAAPA